MNLFQHGRFISAAGKPLDWKIECDALTDDDWKCIAEVMAPSLPPFREAIAVPTGGIKLAEAMAKHKASKALMTWCVLLICDDVWTTGKSMRACAVGHGDDWIGLVAFARGPLPPNVKALWTLTAEG